MLGMGPRWEQEEGGNVCLSVLESQPLPLTQHGTTGFVVNLLLTNGSFGPYWSPVATRDGEAVLVPSCLPTASL